LSLWCELPASRPGAGALALVAEAERQGVAVSPGPVFAVDGGLDRFVRIPYTRPVAELRDAVERLAGAWETVRSGRPARGQRRSRVMVA
jgi:DNA-binding transcriptional MocR family regulator